LDVNGDGRVTALDALLIINYLHIASHASSSIGSIQQANPAELLVGLDRLREDTRFTTLDGRGVAVVVIDTGLELDHSFFGPDVDGDGVADRIVYQYDFADGNSWAADRTGHGTHVTSIIASQDSQFPGVAPGVDIIHLKVFEDLGRGTFAYLEQALQWVVSNVDTYNIAAVNLSLGDSQNWTQSVGLYGISDELAALDALGVITVAAAGNSYALFGGQPGLAYPAADPNTISVGAVWDADRGRQSFGGHGIDFTTDVDRLASFSQRHPANLDALAPGAIITGAYLNGTVASLRGTSMAAPYLSGAAVLAQQLAMQQHGRRLSNSDFRELLQQSSVLVFDGDDEDASVPSTSSYYARLDLPSLAESVWNLDFENEPDDGAPTDGGPGVTIEDPEGLVSQSVGYTLSLGSGEHFDSIDFGVREEGVTVPDRTAPTSRVDALPQRVDDKSFVVSVTGVDGEPGSDHELVSGVAYYDVYVAEGSGNYRLWQTLPASTPQAVFNGESNKTYFFRSIARDAAGNVESKPMRAEALTYVTDFDAPVAVIDNVDSASVELKISMTGTDAGNSRLTEFDLYVAVDSGDARRVATVAAGLPDHEGVYRATATYMAIADGAAHTYRFSTLGRDGNGNEQTEIGNEVSVTETFTAPESLSVVSLDVQRGMQQRSYLRYVDVQFNQVGGLQEILDTLTDSDPTNDRLRLDRYELDGSGPAESISLEGLVSLADTQLMIDFGEGGIGGNADSSAGDGYYTLSIDTNADGEADQAMRFYRLFGDTNGDRTVDNIDVAAIASAIRNPALNPDADVNGDGEINAKDRFFASLQRGNSLASHLHLDD